MLEKGLQLKTTTLLVFYSVVTKVFEKPVNNGIVDHLEKCVFFFYFQCDFRSSQSTADLLTVASERISGTFNRSGTNWTVALDISRDFDRIWHVGILHKLKCYGVSGQIFGLISSFLSNKQLQVVLNGKSSQEYPVNAGVPGATFSCYTLMTFLMMLSVILHQWW